MCWFMCFSNPSMGNALQRGYTNLALAVSIGQMVEKTEPGVRGSVIDGLTFGVTALTALFGYVVTLAPQVTLGFAGIFSTAAMHGGVPHPPGYPLTVLWQQTFVKLLPVSNLAWRVGVSSSVAGAFAGGGRLDRHV